jgi:hypothetical protein
MGDTHVDLGAWLRDLGLGQYERLFRDHAVDSEILPQLAADDLREIGVTPVGHRRKLLAALTALREGTPFLPVRPVLAEPAVPTAGVATAPTTTEAERRQLTVMSARRAIRSGGDAGSDPCLSGRRHG